VNSFFRSSDSFYRYLRLSFSCKIDGFINWIKSNLIMNHVNWLVILAACFYAWPVFEWFPVKLFWIFNWLFSTTIFSHGSVILKNIVPLRRWKIVHKLILKLVIVSGFLNVLKLIRNGYWNFKWNGKINRRFLGGLPHHR
jgi:hypothetical protein